MPGKNRTPPPAVSGPAIHLKLDASGKVVGLIDFFALVNPLGDAGEKEQCSFSHDTLAEIGAIMGLKKEVILDHMLPTFLSQATSCTRHPRLWSASNVWKKPHRKDQARAEMTMTADPIFLTMAAKWMSRSAPLLFAGGVCFIFLARILGRAGSPSQLDCPQASKHVLLRIPY